MKEDIINYLIENPHKIQETLKVYKEKYGQHEADRFETAIYARKRRLLPDNAKCIKEMIEAGTRKITGGGDYYFGTGVIEQNQTSKDDVNIIAKMIKQGTEDILSNPGMSPNEAVTLGILRRELQNEQ